MDKIDVAIVSGLFLIAVAIIAFLGDRRLKKAQAQNTDVDTIASLRELVNGFVKDIKELTKRDIEKQERIDEMQVLIDALGRRIDSWENRWVEVKKWFDLFIAWVEERGYSGYPPIPKSIKERDTKDRMKPVKGNQ